MKMVELVRLVLCVVAVFILVAIGLSL